VGVAPLVDLVRLERFGGRKAWIVLCQAQMFVTLLGSAYVLRGAWACTGTSAAVFMGLTNPLVAATQFTGYMALRNLTISYTNA
jgi:hypothetical protein